jgi:hypothetical protein
MVLQQTKRSAKSQEQKKIDNPHFSSSLVGLVGISFISKNLRAIFNSFGLVFRISIRISGTFGCHETCGAGFALPDSRGLRTIFSGGT